MLLGSQGDDLVNGGDGNDMALMGAGDDTFVWNPGDDNDTLEGQAGIRHDALQRRERRREHRHLGQRWTGALLPQRRQRDHGPQRCREIDFNALGGADNIVVNDLSGTDVTEINLNLAGTIGGTAGDAQPDNVIVQGTNGDDVVLVFGDASGDGRPWPGGPGEHHWRRGCERPADGQRPGRGRRGGGLGPGG